MRVIQFNFKNSLEVRFDHSKNDLDIGSDSKSLLDPFFCQEAPENEFDKIHIIEYINKANRATLDQNRKTIKELKLELDKNRQSLKEYYHVLKMQMHYLNLAFFIPSLSLRSSSTF